MCFAKSQRPREGWPMMLAPSLETCLSHVNMTISGKKLVRGHGLWICKKNQMYPLSSHSLSSQSNESPHSSWTERSNLSSYDIQILKFYTWNFIINCWDACVEILEFQFLELWVNPNFEHVLEYFGKKKNPNEMYPIKGVVNLKGNILNFISYALA